MQDTTPRKSKIPRVAASYRAARRNAFRGSVWPAPKLGGVRKIEPYVIKAPRVRQARNRITGAVVLQKGAPVYYLFRPAQPITYPAGWRTPAERAARRVKFGIAA